VVVLASLYKTITKLFSVQDNVIHALVACVAGGFKATHLGCCSTFGKRKKAFPKVEHATSQVHGWRYHVWKTIWFHYSCACNVPASNKFWHWQRRKYIINRLSCIIGTRRHQFYQDDIICDIVPQAIKLISPRPSYDNLYNCMRIIQRFNNKWLF
jgi:hypothetical protein